MPGFEPIYAPTKHSHTSIVFPFIGQDLLIGPDAELPHADTLKELGHLSQKLQFGVLDGQTCEMEVWQANASLPPGLEVGDYRKLCSRWSQAHLDALSRARQLATWLQQNRFCSVCGQGTLVSAEEPACECRSCGYKAYPRISPVCLGLVLKGNKLLLARSPHFPPGVYSALAGYLEAGESAENCLRREIREEAGIEIQNIRWFGSQSWPYPHALMMGFIADYVSGDLVAQENEIEDIGWFGLDELPRLPHQASLAYSMIEFVRHGGAAVLPPESNR